MLSRRKFIDLFGFGRKLFAPREISTFKPKEFSWNSEYYENYQPDANEIDAIEHESKIRKSRGSVQLLRHYFKNFNSETDSEKKKAIRVKLISELKKFPNKTHPTVLSYGAESDKVELYSFGDLHENPIPNFKSYEELGRMSNTIRMNHLGNFTGPGSYYFMHSVAELEKALIQYTQDILLKEKFESLVVPDILPAELIEGCGMQVEGHPNQVNNISLIISPKKLFQFKLIAIKSVGLSTETIEPVFIRNIRNGIGWFL